MIIIDYRCKGLETMYSYAQLETVATMSDGGGRHLRPKQTMAAIGMPSVLRIWHKTLPHFHGLVRTLVICNLHAALDWKSRRSAPGMLVGCTQNKVFLLHKNKVTRIYTAVCFWHPCAKTPDVLSFLSMTKFYIRRRKVSRAFFSISHVVVMSHLGMLWRQIHW